MIKIPALTFYISAVEKTQFQKYAKDRGVTPTKLVSMIIRAWVQAKMGDTEEEEEYEE